MLFVDRLQLVAVDHPEGRKLPRRRAGARAARRSRVRHARRAALPQAVDEHGHDVLARVDRWTGATRTTSSAPHPRLRRASHADARFGNRREGRKAKRGKANDGGAERMVLLMTGWTDYAFSSDNVAAPQRGHRAAAATPPGAGRRRRVAHDRRAHRHPGRPPPDSRRGPAGRLQPGEHEVRVLTNMRVYWDQVLVDARAARSPRICRASIRSCRPAVARLLRRGDPGRPRAVRIRLRPRLDADRGGRAPRPPHP